VTERKSKQGIVYLVAIIIVIGLCLVGYGFYDNFMKVENNVPTTKPTQNEEEKSLLFYNSIPYTLNSNEYKVTYRYYYQTCDEACKAVNDEVNYAVYVKVLVNDKLIKDVQGIIYFGTEDFKSPSEVTAQIKNDITLGTDNINIFSGDDKEYLLVSLYYPDLVVAGSSKTFIINENNEVIIAFNDSHTTSVRYLDSTLNKFNEWGFYTAENKIYYTKYDITDCTPYLNIISVNQNQPSEKREAINIDSASISGEEC